MNLVRPTALGFVHQCIGATDQLGCQGPGSAAPLGDRPHPQADDADVDAHGVVAEPLVLARGRYERVGENRNVLVSRIESLGPLARVAAESDSVWESLPRPHSFGRRG